jgi:hypothetical protein
MAQPNPEAEHDGQTVVLCPARRLAIAEPEDVITGPPGVARPFGAIAVILAVAGGYVCGPSRPVLGGSGGVHGDNARSVDGRNPAVLIRQM